VAYVVAGQVIKGREHLLEYRSAQVVVRHPPVPGLDDRPQSPLSERHEYLGRISLPLVVAQKLDDVLL
jgi:hypothetical protein